MQAGWQGRNNFFVNSTARKPDVLSTFFFMLKKEKRKGNNRVSEFPPLW